MKVQYKQIKTGTEVTYSCSNCGVVYANYVVMPGERFMCDWSEIAPAVCACGERLLEEVTTIEPRIVVSIRDAKNENN